MEQTILGLPLEKNLPESENYSVSPYSAIAVIKAIDSDGDDVYAVVMTENMTAVEGSGLLNYGKLYTDEKLRKSFKIAKNGPSKTQ